MTITTHSATITREGKWWMIRIPEIAGLTQARRLGEADLMAREYIAVTLDVPLESVAVELTVEPVGEVDVTGRLAEIRDARQRADALEQAAASGAIALAKDLAALNVPRRDIGAILGVSFQRADQLVRSPARQWRKGRDLNVAFAAVSPEDGLDHTPTDPWERAGR